METNNNKKLGLFICIAVLIVALAVVGIVIGGKKDEGKDPEKPDKPTEPIKPTEYNDSDYNLRLIKTANSTQTDNYLISPYSIEIALNMLKDGADGNTKKQIEDVVGTRSINNVISENVKVANAMFVKDKYKPYLIPEYQTLLKDQYNAEILFDEFKKPDIINNWVNEHTDGMIPKILNEMDPNFVYGLANAIAIDVKWDTTFECDATRGDKFTYEDGTDKKVEMMHNTYGNRSAAYFETDNAKGAILKYRADDDDSQLEFVGILPNEDINTYINKLTKEELEAIDNNKKETNSKYKLVLSLPRFTYSFDLKEFKDILVSMGITDAFSPADAQFTNVIKDKDDIFIDEAIHKTYIDLNEEGTKAAAVTYFGAKDNAMMPEEFETVEVNFNKPFVYMIRDVKTKEILFFGVVRTPTEWKGSTCSNS